MSTQNNAKQLTRTIYASSQGGYFYSCICLAFMVLASPLTAAKTVLSFSGSDSYVNLGTPDVLQIPANHPLTVEAWVCLDAFSNEDMLYCKNSFRGGRPYSYMFGIRSSGTLLSAYTGHYGTPATTWVDAALPTALVTGRWYHLAFSYDGTNLSYFLDGGLIGPQSFSFGNRTTFDDLIKIGGYNNASDFSGSVTDMRVWDHARAEAQIRSQMRQRLSGREPGLLGYWRLDDGTGRASADGTPNDSQAELINAVWSVSTNLPLSEFAPINPVTSSPRFTQANVLTVATFVAPPGYTHYQITQDGAIPDDSPAAWTTTNVYPDTVSFVAPASDAAVTLTAWFTNTATDVELRSHTAELIYTSVAPQPVVRASLTRARLPGQNVVIFATDLDAGSNGGTAEGTALFVHDRAAVCATPSDDLTPDAPHVTLSAEGNYPLLLKLRNEAGNTATAVSTCLVSVVAYSGTNTWTGLGRSDSWHDAANWSAGVPTAGQDVAMGTSKPATLSAPTLQLRSFTLGANQVLTFDGWDSALTADDMVVYGTLHHLPQTVVGPETDGSWAPQHRILLAGSNLTVAAGGLLDADQSGYLPRSGPGRSYLIGNYSTGGGGGYGGNGSSGYDGGQPGPAWGDPADPWQPGSGGGAGGDYGNNARPSGGNIRVEMSGTIHLDGKISACGQNGIRYRGSSGSGGGIALYCKTFAGTSGLICANGGQGDDYAGNGGGGRIALHYDPVAQAALNDPRPPVKFSTYAFRHSAGVSYAYAAPTQMGTLYLTDTTLLADNPQGDVVLDGQRFWHTRLYIGTQPESWSPASLLISNCVVGFPQGYKLNVAGDLNLVGTQAPLTGGTDIPAQAGLHLVAAKTNTLYGARLTVGGDLAIGADTWLYPHTEGTSTAIVGIKVGGHVTVAANGGIDAFGRGYVSQSGNKNGTGAGTGWGVAGSYGGLGRNAAASKTYGRADLPLDPGSPGQWTGRGQFTTSGTGGGVIHLLADGTLRIDGLLTSEGANGLYYYGCGGSGGSILLAGERLTGTGTLNAKGGTYSTYAAGGGRVAVWQHVSLAEIERRIDEGDTAGLVRQDSSASFKGTVDVGVYPCTSGTPPTEGTFGFYTRMGTMIILR